MPICCSPSATAQLRQEFLNKHNYPIEKNQDWLGGKGQRGKNWDNCNRITIKKQKKIPLVSVW